MLVLIPPFDTLSRTPGSTLNVLRKRQLNSVPPCSLWGVAGARLRGRRNRNQQRRDRGDGHERASQFLQQ